MQRSHTTTRNPLTYIRLSILVVISLLSVLILPFTGESLTNFFSQHAFNLGLLYAIIIGFLMSISLTRHQELEEHILVELNKIRRIYHLALHLSKLDPKLATWFKQLKRDMQAYLLFFRQHTFKEYESSNTLFRKVTYAAYQLPGKRVAYDETLYSALLEATADATVAREQIQAKKDYHIGHYQWMALLIVSLTFCVNMVLFTPYELIARLTTAVVVFCIFLTLDLLREYDVTNSIKNLRIARQYFENLDKLEIKNLKPKRR